MKYSIFKGKTGICNLFITFFVFSLVFTSELLYSNLFGFQLASLLTMLLSFVLCIININRLKQSYISWFLFLFILCYLVVSVFGNPSSAFYTVYFLFSLTLFLYYFPYFIGNIRYLENIDDIFYRVITVLVVFFVFYFVINFNLYVNDGVFIKNKRIFNNILNNPNLVGYLLYLGITISWFMYSIYRTRMLLLCSFFLVGMILFIPTVLTTYFSLFIFLFVSVFFKTKGQLIIRIILLVSSLIGLFLLLSFIFNNWDLYSNSLSKRDLIWAEAILKILDKPVLGYGVEGWGYLYDDIKNPHNFILYSWLSFGLFGPIFFLSYFSNVYVRILKSRVNPKYVQFFAAQVLVHIAIMSVFVALPGNYQDISIFVSLFISLFTSIVFFQGKGNQ